MNGRPAVWEIASIVRKENIASLSALPSFFLIPTHEDLHQEKEWARFLGFLEKYKKVSLLYYGTPFTDFLPFT